MRNGTWARLMVFYCMVLMLSFVVAFNVNAESASSSTWTVEGVRLTGGWASNADIVKLPNGTYRMYFTDKSPCTASVYPTVIKSAISSDGMNWTKESGIRMGSCSYWAGGSTTVVLPDGRYRMYFTNSRYPMVAPIWANIMSAISTDGLNFTIEPGVRIAYGGQYDLLRTGKGFFVDLGNGMFRMYYEGLNSESSGYRILSATSTDGLNWVKEPGVRINFGGTYDLTSAIAPVVTRIFDGRYMMFYSGADATTYRILSAISEDGLIWEKEMGVRININGLPGGPYYHVFPNHLIKLSDNKYRMFFTGDRYPASSTNRQSIMSATATIQPPNRIPSADAGPDQSVNEGAVVTMDGSFSSDPDNNPLTYIWTQIAGTGVSLNLDNPVHPTFTAPPVGVGGETLTFQLVINDGTLTSSPALVNINIKNVNNPPVASAGDDQTVDENSAVQLLGTGSYDYDGESLAYQWTQIDGPYVSLSDMNVPDPTFTAPLVGSAGATLTFELSVHDGIDGSTDSVTVFIENVNHAPIANAGADHTKVEGSVVILDGSASSDPDGDPLTYSWSQTGGSIVALSDSAAATPTFSAPLVNMGGETLTFQLTVNDGLADSAADEVIISILNTNDPPVCTLAAANPASLWPPNHKMVAVNITGVTDPNNENVVITVTGVTQDEPINGLGDGDTSPDAVIQNGGVALRAERSGTGNGRVYLVSFSANDGQGGTCTGAARVNVPHSNSKNSVNNVIDDGQNYNSVQ